MIEPLRISFEVAAPVTHAFDTWARRIDTWWPASHSVSTDPDLTVVLEGHIGGRLFERTPDGTEHDWGEVTAWEPPGLLAYRWHLRRDRAEATHVEVRFTEVDGARTRVDILHTGWEVLSAEGERWRDANRGGWAGVLPAYRQAAERGADD